MSYFNDIPPHSRVGVFLSGGPDSAILYYQLLAENSDAEFLRFIVPMCAPKFDGADHYAEIINDWVCAKFNAPPPPILYIGNPHQRHDLIVRNAVINVMQFGIADFIFLADTTNPPETLSGLAPVRERVDHPMIRQPFFDLTKDLVLSRFYEEGIEELLALTHTCTERPRGACWECWQCNERKWAFKQLGLVDPLLNT